MTSFRSLRPLVCVAGLLTAGTCLHPSAAQQPPAQSPVPKPPATVAPPGRIRGPGDQSGDKLVRVRMISDVERVQPNQTFHLAFIFDIEPHWHIYWSNSGASGGPTEIAVTAPPGFTVSPVLFPRPRIMKSEEGLTYGYEDQIALFVEVTPPPSAPPQVGFTADVNWLVCKEVCKMGGATTTLSLPFGGAAMPGSDPKPVDPLIKTWLARVPMAITDMSGASATFDGANLILAIPAGTAADAEFFPNPSPGVEFGKPAIEKHGETLTMTVPTTINANNALGKSIRVAGVIGLGRLQQDPCYWFDIPFDSNGKPRPN